MSDTTPYFQRMQMIKLGILPKEAVAKPKKPISKKSKNKIAEEKAEKNLRNDDTEKEKWFNLIRGKLTGFCKCGCGMPSSKKDYKNLEGKIESHYRSSCCHIFPKSKFHSIKYHELNFVERSFWGGCHSVMDDTSIERWVNMADWEDIKANFYILAPLLTAEEKATKFHSMLENLVNNN